jgi:hypothetical protein
MMVVSKFWIEKILLKPIEKKSSNTQYGPQQFECFKGMWIGKGYITYFEAMAPRQWKVLVWNL